MDKRGHSGASVTAASAASGAVPSCHASISTGLLRINRLPARTNNSVRVRSLDRVGEGSAVVPRPATAATAAQASSAGRTLPLKLLRFPVVRERTGLSRSTIWRLERRGEFPKHHRIAPNVVAWVEEDVHMWIEARVG